MGFVKLKFKVEGIKMKDTQKHTTNLIRDRVSVNSLIHDLKGLNSFIRLSGAYGFQGTRNKSVVEHLINKLDDIDPGVRVAAARGLGWMKDKKAVKPLIERLTDKVDEVRFAAIKALGEIGDERAAPQLALLAEKMYPQDKTWKTVLDSLVMIYLETYG